MPLTNTENDQTIEAVVSGPDGANRLFVCTGQANTGEWMGPGQQVQKTWTFHIGPELPHPQFRRATASAYFAAFASFVADPTANGWYALNLVSVEADWDDDRGKAEVRVEVNLQTGPGTNLQLLRTGYSATVLAQLPAT